MGWGERRAWERGAGMLILKQKTPELERKKKGDKKRNQ